MQRPPTKAEIRAELEAQLAAYRADGGAIAEIPRGVSGRYTNENPFSQRTEFPKSGPRTPVPEVVQALDARRKPPAKPVKKRPRKRLITDDFGEPLRWIWEDT